MNLCGVGSYLIVAMETVPSSSGLIKIVREDEEFVKGKVIAVREDSIIGFEESTELYVDDEIIFIKKAGKKLGLGEPENIVVIKFEDVVAVINDEEE